jgi:glycosyltransferase involved in cell wall biosynthesis
MIDVDGVPVLRWHYPAPQIPFVQNYYRHEKLWQPLADLLAHLAQQADSTPLLIHAQHVQTIPAAVLAGQQTGAPVVATVRDHWPWDYFATGLHGNRFPYRPGCHNSRRWAAMITDLVARLGAAGGILALPAMPYMLAHVQRRAAFLAQADAVIAVSSYVADRLAPLVAAERLHIIPNMVDMAAVMHIAAAPPDTLIDEPFLLYVGKLEQNKGAGLLAAIFQALQAFSPVSVPILLIAGSGALQPVLEQELSAAGVRVRFLSWVPHDELLRLMARCELLLFPSAWGEPLSRVLLEAGAVGAPILAMPTGGTGDIIIEGINGALAVTPAQFARRMLDLLNDTEQRRRLGAQAHQIARQRFAVEAVLPQVERLYAALCRA